MLARAAIVAVVALASCVSPDDGAVELTLTAHRPMEANRVTLTVRNGSSEDREFVDLHLLRREDHRWVRVWPPRGEVRTLEVVTIKPSGELRIRLRDGVPPAGLKAGTYKAIVKVARPRSSDEITLRRRFTVG